MSYRVNYILSAIAFACSLAMYAAWADDNMQSDRDTKPDAAISVPVPSNNQIQKLADVKKIFVASLGTARGAELIQQKIINQLTESGHIVVVDSIEEADASFNGIARLHRYGLYDDLVTSGDAVVRLTGKDKQILWTDDDNINKFPGYGSANKTSFKIADKLVKDLINAIELDKSK